MQIRPGGEKLSDTKVGEFDRRPFFASLTMQPTQQTLPPIITDPVIRSIAACRPRNRLPSSAEQNKKKRETQTIPFQRRLVHFFFCSCCCQEMNKWLSMFGEEISHLLARFSQLILFSPYKAGNEISLCAVSPLVQRPPPLIFSTLLSGSPLPRERVRSLLSISKQRSCLQQ